MQSKKCALVQALRLCTGRTAHRWRRGITLLFLDHGIRRPLFTPGKDPVPIVQEAGWVLAQVWTCAENLAPPPGFDPRTVQPVAGRYNDYATRPKHAKYLPKLSFLLDVLHFQKDNLTPWSRVLLHNIRVCSLPCS